MYKRTKEDLIRSDIKRNKSNEEEIQVDAKAAAVFSAVAHLSAVVAERNTPSQK